MTFLGITYNTDIQLFSRLYDRKMRNQITEAFTHFGRQKAQNSKVKFPINIHFKFQDVCCCSETSCANRVYGRYRYDSDLVNLHYIEVKMALAGVQ